MAKLLKLRRGTTTQHGSFTGAEGEVTIDTTKDTAVVHDGSQAGGRPLAREDMTNVSSASIAGRLSNDSIATSKIAAGALPSDVTVASANLVDGTIVNADVNASAAIGLSKLATGALPTGITIARNNLNSSIIKNSEVAADAAIARTKLANVDVVDDTSPQLGGDLQSNGNDIDFADNDKAIFGTGSDMELVSDGSTSYIRADDLRIRSKNNLENYITCAKDGAVTVFHDSVKKFETTSSGASVTGNLNVSSGADVTGDVTTTGDINIDSNSKKLKLGDGQELQISHNGSQSIITDTAHPVFLKGNQVHIQSANGNMISCYQDAQTELFHNEVKRLETTTSGVTVTSNLNCGNLFATSAIGLDSTDYLQFTNNTRMDITINGNNEFRFEADGDFHAAVSYTHLTLPTICSV